MSRKLLKSITATFQKEVAPYALAEKLSYTPILAEINGKESIVGYFHPRCYEDLVKILNPSNQHPIGLS